jgi:hypothetical protein
VKRAGLPQLATVIFDPQVSQGSWEAVYMSALAEQLTVEELDRGLGIFAPPLRSPVPRLDV